MQLKEAQQKLNKRYPKEKLKIISWNKENNAKKSCEILCEKCNNKIKYTNFQSATASSKKYCCTKCGRKEKSLKRFEQSLRDTFPNEPFEVIEYTNTQKPCKIKCLTCGNILERAIAGQMKVRKHLCSICHPIRSDELKKSISNFDEYIKKSKNWELNQSLEDITKSSDTIQCKCLHCGKINNKTMYDYMRGINCRCLTQTAKDWFKKHLPSDYQVISQTGSYRQRISLRHSCGFVYSVVSQTFINGYGRCPKCEKRSSFGERQVKTWLEEHNISYEREYTVVLKNHALRFDFYLPEYDLYIEYQGEQHYEPIDFFGGEEKFKEIQYYDELKQDYAKEKLIAISYKENVNDILSSKVQRLSQKESTL